MVGVDQCLGVCFAGTVQRQVCDVAFVAGEPFRPVDDWLVQSSFTALYRDESGMSDWLVPGDHQSGLGYLFGDIQQVKPGAFSAILDYQIPVTSTRRGGHMPPSDPAVNRVDVLRMGVGIGVEIVRKFRGFRADNKIKAGVFQTSRGCQLVCVRGVFQLWKE